MSHLSTKILILNLRPKKFLSLSLLLAVAANIYGKTPRLEQNTDMIACNRWVDSVYNSLNERQRIAQLVFPKVVTTQGATTKSALKRLVQAGVGGILFTEGSIAQYAEMTNYAQSLARVPLLMTFDGEWGLAMRIKNTIRFPNNMAIGAARNGEELAYLYGREMARECKAAGIQVNFAPVADVNSNAHNPVIGYRSFGEDAQWVSKLVNAYSRGLEDGGVQAVAKHFPGHGDTSTDSHMTLPVVNKTMKQLSQTELVPFKNFIDEGFSGMMTAHLLIKSIDKSGTPMSLSPKAYNMLRDDLGFEGLIYTDALGMKGAVTPDGTNESVAALKAGADVLLSPRDPIGVIELILADVQKGNISKALIEEHCKRVLTYKYILGLAHGAAKVDADMLEALAHDAEADRVNRIMSASVITALVNKDNTLPIGNLAERKIAVVTVPATAHATDADIIEQCRKYADVKVFKGELTQKTINDLRGFSDVLVFVTDDKGASVKETDILASLDNVVSVFMVNPYKMAKMSRLVKASKAVVLAYDDTPMLRNYAVQAVFGGIDVDGRLPVTLTGLFDRGAGLNLNKTRLGYTSPSVTGMNPALTDSIDALINLAVANNAIPGAQVLIAHKGNVVHDKAYGKLTAGGTDVDPFTLYDLASVSKAIGTLPGVMVAVDKGYMEIDKPLSTYINGLNGTGKDSLLVKQFLFHETGIPASLNVFMTVMDTMTYEQPLMVNKPDATHNRLIQRGLYGHDTARLRGDLVAYERSDRFPIEMAEGMYVGPATIDTIMSRIYNIERRPTNDYVYSCLNFSLLMDGEQSATGVPHQVWCDSLIWSPLGAWTMGYRPSERFPKSTIAPTEKDTYLRNQVLQGYVHDEMAAFLGGVSGNAGLFANANDIAKICQMWLNGGTYGGARILSPETVRLFTTTVSPTCRRGLGFDKPDTKNPDNSPTTELANASTFGHLGFTGTVFWVDPDNDLIVIFLTNRVNPTRDNDAFASMNIRPEIMRQALLAIPDRK